MAAIGPVYAVLSRGAIVAALLSTAIVQDTAETIVQTLDAVFLLGEESSRFSRVLHRHRRIR